MPPATAPLFLNTPAMTPYLNVRREGQQGTKVAWTALLFPLAARDAASHADDVTDRGHTDPVKNGDAFERLGIMTHLADKEEHCHG